MKRNPNGYGCVTKLTGERAKPYAVYSNSYKLNGKRHHDVIGYFKTEAEARNALAEWNKSRSTKNNYKLNELYQEWSAEHFDRVSYAAVRLYSAAWNKLQSLYNMYVRDIKTGHFQQIINAMDKQGYSAQSMRSVKTLAGLLEKYAMQYDIITKNYAEFINIPAREKIEKQPFTETEINAVIEAAKANIGVSRAILILIYSGWRVQEFLHLEKKNCSADFLSGGMKTENGKNRTVPVHPAIKEYVAELLKKQGSYLYSNHGKAISYHCFFVAYKKTLSDLGISALTPHATRHTFATLCYRYGVESLATKKMLGHSVGGGITEQVYIHIDNDILEREIAKIPSAFC